MGFIKQSQSHHITSKNYTSYKPVHQLQGYRQKKVFHSAPAGGQTRGCLHQNSQKKLLIQLPGLLPSRISQTGR